MCGIPCGERRGGIRMTVSKANLIVLCFVSGGVLCGVWSCELSWGLWRMGMKRCEVLCEVC